MAVGDITERWVVQKRSLVDGSLTWSTELSLVNTLNFYPKSVTVAEDGIWIAGSIGTSSLSSRSGYVEKRDKTTGVLITAFYVIGGVSAVLDGVHSPEAITFIAGAKKGLTGDWKWYMAAIGASLTSSVDLMHHLKWFEDEVFKGEYLLSRAKYHDYTPAEPVHTILPPVTPAGESSGRVGVINTFSIAFTQCNPDHSDQIRVDWDDGAISAWNIAQSSPISITYSWAAAGTYHIIAQAMCRNTGIMSSWSELLTVVIS